MLPVFDQNVVVVGRAKRDIQVCLVMKALGEPLGKMVKGAQAERRAILD